MSFACSSDNTMSQSEIDALKHSKPPTQADLKTVQDAASKQAEAAKKQQLEWAKANPDKAAAANASRAKVGLPPLGQ